jgi:hypothetical protein
MQYTWFEKLTPVSRPAKCSIWSEWAIYVTLAADRDKNRSLLASVCYIVCCNSRNYRLRIKPCICGGNLFVRQSSPPSHQCVAPSLMSTSTSGNRWIQLSVQTDVYIMHPAVLCCHWSFIRYTVPGLALEQIYHFCNLIFVFNYAVTIVFIRSANNLFYFVFLFKFSFSFSIASRFSFYSRFMPCSHFRDRFCFSLLR